MLNVTKDLPNVFEASGGIEYLQIPITDHYSQDLAMHFPAAIQFIGKFWNLIFYVRKRKMNYVSLLYSYRGSSF